MDLTSRFVRLSDLAWRACPWPLPADHWSRPWEYAWAGGFVQPGQRVLDAACGVPHGFKFWLATQRVQAHCCDSDERLRNENETAWAAIGVFGREADPFTLYRRLYPLVADIRALPYPDAYFDRVFCLSALEHIDRRVGALRELGRVCRADGLVVVTVDVPTYPTAQLRLDAEAAGLRPAGEWDGVAGPDPLEGRGLRIFRAAMRKGEG